MYACLKGEILNNEEAEIRPYKGCNLIRIDWKG